MTLQEYVAMSLELDLFFLRIMKEHSLFLELGFTPRDSKFAAEAADFRQAYERLLAEATELANDHVGGNALDSKQFATQYTLDAERLTSFYTGIRIDSNITRAELILEGSGSRMASRETAEKVEMLNRRAYRLTGELVQYKQNLLDNVRACKMFTTGYPLLIDHILREAKFFMGMLVSISKGDTMTRPEDLIAQEAFWDRIMAEHSKFIAGLLDPTEEKLIDTARMFGKQFDTLAAASRQAVEQTMAEPQLTRETLDATIKLRDFKAAGTKGILECKVSSIIVPLLGDHVLREANHFLCVLGMCKSV